LVNAATTAKHESAQEQLAMANELIEEAGMARKAAIEEKRRFLKKKHHNSHKKQARHITMLDGKSIDEAPNFVQAAINTKL
jgi:hypothetical protein